MNGRRVSGDVFLLGLRGLDQATIKRPPSVILFLCWEHGGFLIHCYGYKTEGSLQENPALCMTLLYILVGLTEGKGLIAVTVHITIRP